MSKSFFLGVVISPMALFINSFATFSLPKDMQKANVLVPALQSNWLMMHVTIMMLSYAALICGSLLAITFLIITYRTNLNLENTKKTFSILFLNHHKWSDHTTISDGDRVLAPSPSKQSVDGTVTSWNQKENSIQLQNSKIFSSYGLIQDSQKKSTKVFLSPQSYSLGSPSEQLEPSKSGSQKLYPTQEESKLAKTIDNLSYRTLGIGFPLLTIGILSGSVWANEAWGSYWSWDPKETWAFITWLIFAIYLHTRITKGWQGEKPAIIASFGFLIVWICYLGVNLLGKGLHSYGWIQ
jgi:cytochrome c-type biogenesis protein CcsB